MSDRQTGGSSSHKVTEKEAVVRVLKNPESEHAGNTKAYAGGPTKVLSGVRLQLVVGSGLSSLEGQPGLAGSSKASATTQRYLAANFQKNASAACDICAGANRQPLHSMFAFTPRDGSIPEARA